MLAPHAARTTPLAPQRTFYVDTIKGTRHFRRPIWIYPFIFVPTLGSSALVIYIYVSSFGWVANELILPYGVLVSVAVPVGMVALIGMLTRRVAVRIDERQIVRYGFFGWSRGIRWDEVEAVWIGAAPGSPAVYIEPRKESSAKTLILVAFDLNMTPYEFVRELKIFARQHRIDHVAGLEPGAAPSGAKSEA